MAVTALHPHPAQPDPSPPQPTPPHLAHHGHHTHPAPPDPQAAPGDNPTPGQPPAVPSPGTSAQPRGEATDEGEVQEEEAAEKGTEGGEQAGDGKYVDPLEGLTGKKRKLAELKMKMSEARKLNDNAARDEQRRLKV